MYDVSCSVDGCDKPHRSRGYCDYHYKKYIQYPKNPEFYKNLINENAKKYYQENYKGDEDYNKRHAENEKRRRINLRFIVLYYYSGGEMKCECCGEIIEYFLSIDHINNDGYKQRKKYNSVQIYSWIVRNHFPKGFRVLCMNCNWGRRMNGGVCPHKESMNVFINK